MYPRTKVVLIGQVGIVVLVLFSYPLQLHPARASLDKFLFPHRVALSDDDRDDGSNADEDCSHGGGGGEEIPLGRFVLESAALLFATFLIAMFVSSLEIVLGFVGATGSTTISFILPSVFCTSSGLGVSPQRTQNPSETDQDVCAWEPVLSLFKDSESPHDRRLRFLALLLLSWGICVMVVSLSLNICAFSLVLPPLAPGWAGAKRDGTEADSRDDDDGGGLRANRAPGPADAAREPTHARSTRREGPPARVVALAGRGGRRSLMRARARPRSGANSSSPMCV